MFSFGLKKTPLFICINLDMYLSYGALNWLYTVLENYTEHTFIITPWPKMSIDIWWHKLWSPLYIIHSTLHTGTSTEILLGPWSLCVNLLPQFPVFLSNTFDYSALISIVPTYIKHTDGRTIHYYCYTLLWINGSYTKHVLYGVV